MTTPTLHAKKPPHQLQLAEGVDSTSKESTVMTDSMTIRRPWWMTSTEDLTAGEPVGPTDLAVRHQAIEFKVPGSPDIDAKGTGVEVRVVKDLRRDGTVGVPLNVEVFADDGHLNAAGARELAKALLLAADVFDQIEETDRG